MGSIHPTRFFAYNSSFFSEELFSCPKQHLKVTELAERKPSNLSWSYIIERLKHSTILIISQQTLRLSVHKRLKSIAKLATFFFCEDKQSPIDNKRLDYLRISFSVRFLSDATLVMARLLQYIYFLNICNTLNSFFCPHLEIKCSTS